MIAYTLCFAYLAVCVIFAFTSSRQSDPHLRRRVLALWLACLVASILTGKMSSTGVWIVPVLGSTILILRGLFAGNRTAQIIVLGTPVVVAIVNLIES
jgi:hypothetical protein